MTEIKTYADGFGTWHARIATPVGNTTSLTVLRRRASLAIRAELLERGMSADHSISVRYNGMTSNPGGGFFENFTEK